MGSILLVLSLCIILFTLISDFNQFCTGILDLEIVHNHHCFTDLEEGQPKSSGQSQVGLVPSQTGYPNFDCSASQAPSRTAQKAPFQRSQFHRDNQPSDEHGADPALEMFTLQESVQWETQPLREMWAAMDHNYGSRFCTAHPLIHPQTGHMEPGPMVGCKPLESNAMGEIAKEKAISAPKTQTIAERSCGQRQRQVKAARRQYRVWPAVFAIYASFGSTVDDFFHNTSSGASWSPSSIHTRWQGRQGQGEANEIPRSGAQETPGHVARGRASADEGCFNPSWARGDKAAARCGFAAWKSQTRDCRRSGCQAEHARCMEELSVAIGATMDCIHKSVHVSRTAAHGTHQDRAGQFGHRKRESQQFPGGSWCDSKGGHCNAQRCRRLQCQRVSIVSWTENSSQLPRPGQQPPSPAQSSSASCTARGRPARQKKTESHLTSTEGGGQGRNIPAEFWRGRVNTPTKCIAHMPQLLHGDQSFVAGSDPKTIPSCHDGGVSKIFTMGLTWDMGRSYSYHGEDVHEVTISTTDSSRATSPCAFEPHQKYTGNGITPVFIEERQNLEHLWSSLKWGHSIVSESDFMDEWTAQDRAFHLAIECQAHNFASGSPSFGFTLTPPAQRLTSERFFKKTVSFCEVIELFIGLEDDREFATITVPHQSLNMPDKPWALVSRFVQAGPSKQKVDHRTRALSCEDHDVACSGSLVDPFCSKADSEKFLHQSIQTSSFVQQATRSVQKPFPSFAFEPKAQCGCSPDGSCPCFHDGCLHCLQVPTPSPCWKCKCDCTATPDAVLCSSFTPMQRQPQPLPFPVSQHRLEHESPIADLSHLPHLNDGNDVDDFHQQAPQLPIPPAFVADLSARFLRLGFDIDSGDFDVLLRTWYIDHATIRRWTAPRNLQLVGPPGGWEQQFSSLWVDQINPAEWFDLTIIHPDPPRTLRNSRVVFDVVVTQSLQLERFAGLVTVYPYHVGSFDLYSVAASFEPILSGYDIAQAADATEPCRYHTCTVTFGWNEIPFSLRPQHDMSHGDGFQLMISLPPDHMPSDASSQPGSSTDRPPKRHCSAAPDASGTSSSAVTSAQHAFCTPLHLFQIAGHEVVIELLNAQVAQPTHAMADALGVPFDCIEALHIMPIHPDGFPELAIPAIVQRVGDIDLRSTDRLIMIDVIYHHHPSPSGITNQPTVVREVHRVAHQIARQTILFQAGVYHYCEFLQEGCAVSLDGFLWPFTHTDPRPVSHGSYATVDVPPLQGAHASTRDLAQALEHDGHTNAFLNFLREPIDWDEDTTSLLHIVASSQVIPSVVQRRLRHVSHHGNLLPDSQRYITGSRSHPENTSGEQPHTPQDWSFLDQRPVQVAQHDVLKQASPHGVNDDAANRLPHAELDAAATTVGVADANQTPCDQVSTPAVAAHRKARTKRTCSSSLQGSTKQASLNSYFRKTTKAQHLEAKTSAPACQTKISDFFTKHSSAQADATTRVGTAHAPIEMHRDKPSQSNLCASNPEGTGGCRPATIHSHLLVRDACPPSPDEAPQAKCAEQHETTPPRFNTAKVPAADLPPPRTAPRPAWRLHLSNLFDELATVEHRDIGPVMQVEVWYIHHDAFPTCEAPRAVQLDNMQEFWYADMCNAWLDRIQRHQPMRVVNVLPNPPFHIRPGTAVHVILEQGFNQDRVAIHFTAIFRGGTRIGLFQRVESTPSRICTQDMITKHGFDLQCAYRACVMHSGVMRFSDTEPEEIFSGISAVLTVAPPPPEPAGFPRRWVNTGPPLADANNPDQTSLMQMFPGGPVLREAAPDPTATTRSPFDHRMTPAALSEFRATLEWQSRSIGHTCASSPPEAFPVVT